MAIKRFTIEVDDSPEDSGSTKTPENSAEQEFVNAKHRGLTGGKEYPDEDSTASTSGYGNSNTTIGRSYPDIISEGINNPRTTCIIFLVISCVTFASRIDSLWIFNIHFI